MGAAIGLAALIVVVGVLLPNVLTSVEEFVLTFLHRATALLNSIEMPSIRPLRSVE